MKTLLLFRHAKSDWDADFDHDHDRPLSKRGLRAAKQMGSYLSAIGSPPARVVTSSAVRAVKTVELAAAAGRWKCEVEVDDRLYEADPGQVLNLIQEQSDPTDPLMLVGHEPAFSTIASLLIGGGHLHMPTAAVARIEFDADRWADVKAPDGRLVWLITPKLLAGQE